MDETDRYNNGLNPIKTISQNKWLKDQLFKPKEEIATYSNDKLAIGKRRDGTVFYIDIKESIRVICLAPNRAGKTWIFRSEIDRLLMSDKSCVYLTDFKDELKSSSEPLQQKFHHLLLKGEKPQGFETITLRPTFFKSLQEYNELAKGNIWYSVKLSDITQGDFKLLTGYYNLHPNQQITMDIIWENLKKEKFTRWEQIDEIIDRMEDINDVSAMSMKRKFMPLKLSHFYEEEHCRDIIPAIENGVVFGINYENFEAFGRENTGLVQAFNAMMLRKIIMARRAKRISRQIHIFIDEFTRVVPIDKETATKIEVQQSVQLDARYGINYWFAVQDLNLFPEDILTQCRYILLPHNASVPTIQKILMHTALTRYVQRSYQDAVGVQQRMKKHDWLVVDRLLHSMEIISPLAPLSCHAETTK